MRNMWAATLWSLLFVSGVRADQHGYKQAVDTDTILHALMSRGGAARAGHEDDNVPSINSSRQPDAMLMSTSKCSNHSNRSSPARRRTAWSLPLPWLSRRRRGRRKDTNRRIRGAPSTATPNIDASGKAEHTAVAFNSALASFLGTMLLTGYSVAVCPQAAGASPFDPRIPPKSKRQPFFEGWFIRLVDHEQRLSFAVIFGSFRARGAKELDQHYVSLSYLHDPKGGIHPTEDVAGSDESPNSVAGHVRGTDEADVNSSDVRASKIAKKFAAWGREQHANVMRGLGSDGVNQALELPEGAVVEKNDAAEATGKEGSDDETRESRTDAGSGNDADIISDDRQARHPPTHLEERESWVPLESELDPLAEDEGRKTQDADAGVEGETENHGEEPHAVRGPQAATTFPSENYSDGGESEAGTEMEGGEEILGKESADPSHADESVSSHPAAGTGWAESGMKDDRPSEDLAQPSSRLPRPPVEVKPSSREDTVGQDGPLDTFPSRQDEVSPSRGTQSRLRESDPRKREERSESLARDHDRAEDTMSAERTWTFHAFPPADTVTISSHGEPVDSVPNLHDDPNFTWEADGIGSFMVDGDTGRLSFELPELSVAASFRYRLPWSEDHPNSAGPEGWLQRTGLLPLHYFVHTMGSEAGYSLKATDAPRAVVGKGSMHMEANYGESFPTGWVWAQGCSSTEGLCGNIFTDGDLLTPDSDGTLAAGAADSHDLRGSDDIPQRAHEGDEDQSNQAPARFVLTGGRFLIGPFTTKSFVLAFRSKLHNWNFRTTDLDRITVTASRKENRLSITAKSWGSSRVLEADIQAPEGSFGSAIYVPTPEGFSNSPGCVESYAATATFRLYTKRSTEEGSGVRRPLVLREEVQFKLSALEFGGEYQDT